jgi:hypothetical protein
MGGIIDSIFGGGAGKASDKSLEFIKDVYGENKGLAAPWNAGGLQSFNQYNAMLSGPGQDEAFQKWLGSSDYKFTTDAGLNAINHNMASKGLLNSGSTLKAITQFGQDNAQQYRNNYMNQLMGSAGLGAGVLGNLMGSNQNMASAYGNQAMAGAQGRANGMGNFMNFGIGIASLIPGLSDRRTKTDIKHVGRTHKNKGSLPVFSYRYKDDPPNVRRMGVMAQDVAKRRPKALGPLIGNAMTVDYKELARNA